MPGVHLSSVPKTPLVRFPAPARNTRRGVLLSLAIAVAPSMTAANPIPPSAVLVHVQRVDSNWCDLNRVASCAEIVQSTDVSGPLEFDLFFYDPLVMDHGHLERLSTVVEWSERWQMLNWEICHGGEGTVEIDGNEASLDLSWPGGGEPMTTEVLLAARFFVVVDGPGYFGQVDPVVGEAVLRSWPTGPPFDLSPKQCAAEAGSPCDDCHTSCDLHIPCRPTADPSKIDIVLVEGESTRAEVEVRLRGWSGCGPTTFVTTAEWLNATPELSSGTWRVALDIDASALRPGDYTGYLRAENECAGCAELNLLVIPTPSPVVSSTWGHIKTLHP